MADHIDITRRAALVGAAALATASRASAQAGPLRIGFLTVKTGPLAAGGIQMEQGITLYLKERNNTLAGRPIELFTADTGGTPANARTKTQELVERNEVAVLIGPLAAFELLAIDDYIREKQVPWICVAAAEDATQRRANPWLIRVNATSGQCSHALANYAFKDLNYKRMATIGDDFAYGQEQNAGFQRAFEDAGGHRSCRSCGPPLNAPDYATFIAQLKPDLDAIFMSFAGSNGFRFFKQYKEYGGTIPLIGGMTAVDEAILQQMGDDAIGTVSTNYYSAQIDTPLNRTFVDGMQRDYKVDPGYYAAGSYIAGARCWRTRMKKLGAGGLEKRGAGHALMRALRGETVATASAAQLRFDAVRQRGR